MTLQELRDELERTRPAWDELADFGDVLEDGELPALCEDAPARAGTERVAAAAKQWLTWPPLVVIAAGHALAPRST